MEAIPTRMRGYNIIAQMPKLYFTTAPDLGPNWYFSPREYIILGHDPSRRHDKYVVGTVFLDAPVTEWYWGHYTELELKALQHFRQLVWGDQLNNFPESLPLFQLMGLMT